MCRHFKPDVRHPAIPLAPLSNAGYCGKRIRCSRSWNPACPRKVDNPAMAWKNIAIVKAPDDTQGNEQFYIVQFDPAMQPMQPGYLRERQGPLSEAAIRDFLKTFGQTIAEVDEMFRTARFNHTL